MRFFDAKFRNNMSSYILQSAFAMVIVFIILFLTDTISNMTVVASLGASTFITMTAPHADSARSRFLIGSYIVGAFCGICMHFLNSLLTNTGFEIFGHSPHVLICALTVGLAVLLMTLFNVEHPPAAALAMGFVLESNVFKTAFIALISIVLLSLIKTAAKKWLKNLL